MCLPHRCIADVDRTVVLHSHTRTEREPDRHGRYRILSATAAAGVQYRPPTSSGGLLLCFDCASCLLSRRRLSALVIRLMPVVLDPTAHAMAGARQRLQIPRTLNSRLRVLLACCCRCRPLRCCSLLHRLPPPCTGSLLRRADLGYLLRSFNQYQEDRVQEIS